MNLNIIKGASKYTENTLFLIILLITNGFRDFILLIIDLGLNIYLAMKMKQFFDKKMAIKYKSEQQKPNKNRQPRKKKAKKLSTSEVKNTITTIALSFFSILQHILTFMVFIMILISTDKDFIWSLQIISGFSTQVKHASNLVILSIFNSKFRAVLIKLFTFTSN